MSSDSPPPLRFTQLLLIPWRRKWVRVALWLLLALWLFDRLVTVTTEAQWFAAIGYSSVWKQKFLLQMSLAAIAMAATFLLLLWPVRTLTASHSGPLRASDEYAKLLAYARRYQQYAGRFAWCLIAALALLAGGSLANHWREWLLFLHGPAIGIQDAFFTRDAGFYIFRLPFLEALLAIMWRTLSSVLLLTAILTTGQGVIALLSGRTHHLRFMLSPLLVLAAFWFVLRAAGYGFAGVGLITAQHHSEIVPAGMSYLDWNVRRPLLWSGVVFCLLTACLFAFLQRSPRLHALRCGLVVTGSTALFAPVLLVWPVSMIVHWLVVAPDEFNAQKPFVAAHMAASRAAWNLDAVIGSDVDIAPLPPGLPPVPDGSTPVWDAGRLLTAAQSLEWLPPRRPVSTISIDRYQIAGRPRLIAVAAHDATEQGLSQSWINRHVAAPAEPWQGITCFDPTRSTPEGAPALWGTSNDAARSLRLSDARIWYGAAAQEYALLPGKINGAVMLDTFWRRLLWAWRFRDINLFLYSSRKTGVTSLLFRRSILERAETLVPFLQPAGDPFPVIVAGRLVWMLDLMTVTLHYPGAATHNVGAMADAADGEPYNAARDSVKMVMDSQDGHVVFYVAGNQAAREPLLQAWQEAVPGLIRPLAQMPAELKVHRRYPQKLLVAQARLLARYTASPHEFYSRQELWTTTPGEAGTNGQSDVADTAHDDAAHYRLIPQQTGTPRTPAPTEQFVVQMPLSTKPGAIAAVLQAGCDGDDYGRLRLWRVRGRSGERNMQETLKLVMQPQKAGGAQIEGSTPVPHLTQINKSMVHLLLTQSLYMVEKNERLYAFPTGETTAPARLRQVVAVDAAAPAMFGSGSSLGAAVSQLRRKITAAGAGGLASLTPAQQALRAHDAAQAATRRGDWAGAGAWWRRERQILEQMAGEARQAN